jgi:hypothetical protein
MTPWSRCSRAARATRWPEPLRELALPLVGNAPVVPPFLIPLLTCATFSALGTDFVVAIVAVGCSDIAPAEVPDLFVIRFPLLILTQIGGRWPERKLPSSLIHPDNLFLAIKHRPLGVSVVQKPGWAAMGLHDFGTVSSKPHDDAVIEDDGVRVGGYNPPRIRL